MKIRRFKFENKNSELKIEPIDFSDLSLLVGVSGVGKTLILKSILDLKKIAQGESLDGVAWEIQFSIGEDNNYLWKGSFEKSEIPDIVKNYRYYKTEENISLMKIIYEELYLNDHLIVERTKNEIKLEGKATPKLSSYTSVLNLFNEEQVISPVFKGFNKIIQSDDPDIRVPSMIDFDRFLKGYTNFEDIQNDNIPIYWKLAWVYKNKIEIFNKIKDNFIAVFNQIQDIKIEALNLSKDLYPYFQDSSTLQIKEKGVSKWIFYKEISSGMLKTLMQISQLFLCAEGSVILIDEFENSLGINCIDTLTENLLYDNRNLQFILTSHHPYIINAIGMDCWKIVSRNGGVISAKDAKEYKLGKSRHEAFKQLIQLNDYRKGIKA